MSAEQTCLATHLLHSGQLSSATFLDIVGDVAFTPIKPTTLPSKRGGFGTTRKQVR